MFLVFHRRRLGTSKRQCHVSVLRCGLSFHAQREPQSAMTTESSVVISAAPSSAANYPEDWDSPYWWWAPCRFGASCTKYEMAKCPFQHPVDENQQPPGAPAMGWWMKACRYGSDCQSHETKAWKCRFQHPTMSKCISVGGDRVARDSDTAASPDV